MGWLFGGVRAPPTLGSFLRSFSFGYVVSEPLWRSSPNSNSSNPIATTMGL
jgi:hypothetical protein